MHVCPGTGSVAFLVGGNRRIIGFSPGASGTLNFPQAVQLLRQSVEMDRPVP